MSGDDEPVDDDLLVDVAQAVAAMHERLAGVEAALVGGPAAPRRRRRGQPGVPATAAIRKARQRRRDAAGITWTVWAFDQLSLAEQVAALHQIREFVDWLNRAYQLPLSTSAVVPCWYRHPGVVRELWALVASYQNSFTTQVEIHAALPTDAPINWHERVLWPCLRRLRDEHGLRECAATNRHTEQLQNPIATDDGFAGAVEKVAAAGWTR